MGYYTSFGVSFEDVNGFGVEPNEIELIEKQLEEFGFEDNFLHSKWYDYTTDMCKLSAKFPTVLFTLCGEGEESLDTWKEYYLNGKYQSARAKITYPKMNLKGKWNAP